jgi:hypothetical protein
MSLWLLYILMWICYIDVDLLMSYRKNGVIAPVGYCYIGKLAFNCFGPVLKFYSPILSTGGSTYISMEERIKEAVQVFAKLRKGKQLLSMSPGLDEVSLSRIICNLV